LLRPILYISLIAERRNMKISGQRIADVLSTSLDRAADVFGPML